MAELKVFRQDFHVVATLYVVAANIDEATQALLLESNTSIEMLEEGTGGLVRGCSFETLIEEVTEDPFMSHVSMSPAMTLVGPCDPHQVEEVD